MSAVRGAAERETWDLGGGQRLVVASAEAMLELEPGAVDVAVTSPPYNLDKVYHSPGRGRHDDRMAEPDYLDFLERVFREVHRVLREDGLFFVNFGEGARTQGAGERVAARLERAGFLRVQTAIWVKSILGAGHFQPSGGRRRLNHLWEFIYIFAKSKDYRFDPLAIGVPYADKSNVGRYAASDLRDPGDVWFVPYSETTGQTAKKGHPAIFPVELPWRCIRLVPGARRVLDPFAGTGSTLAAAKALGLEGIGYEPYPPREALERRLAAPFAEPAAVLLPELQRGLEELFRLLALLQGRGQAPEVETAFRLLPAASRRRLARLAHERGFLWGVEQA